MTAEKPEGDVALLCHWLRRHPSEGVPIPFAAECAIIVLESQATRIATLTEALELIAEASYLDGACLIARRALSAGQGEAK